MERSRTNSWKGINMAIDIKVPDFPESVAVGTIVAWHKHPGDVVKRDDLLVEIETDKVVFEVPAITDGVLQEILVNEGATVVSGQVLTHIDPAGTQAASSASTGKTESTSSWQTPQDDIITPSARKLIAEHHLGSSKISGSGRGGRVLKEDVLRAMEKTASQPAYTGTRTSVTSGTTGAMARAATTTPLGDRPQKRVPMTRLRTRIAERLVGAPHTAAILTTFNEVNMQPVMDLRSRYREAFEREHKIKLGFMSFFGKAWV